MRKGQTILETARFPEDSASAPWGCGNEDATGGYEDQVAETAREVILTMSRMHVPLSPQNYWVWFDYLTGSNEPLSEEISEHMKKGQAFTESLSRGLYDRHVGLGRDAKLMEDVSQGFQWILKESLENITATGSDTKDYTLKLEGFLGGLEEKGRDPGGLKQMIVRLLLDTRSMERSATKLREQLEKAEKEATELRDKLRRAEREATLDVLTGLHNRKHMERELDALHDAYVSNGTPFSVIMIDLDHFKIINDTHGHKVGDAVLQYIGGIIKGAVKGRDMPARYGGEEFVILLPGTKRADACMLAQHLRQEICKKPLTIRQTGQVIGTITVSAGVAEICGEDTPDTLLERADQALYFAKGQGRDNVKSEADLERKGYPKGPSNTRSGEEISD